jgi:hypothetical protein
MLKTSHTIGYLALPISRAEVVYERRMMCRCISKNLVTYVAEFVISHWSDGEILTRRYQSGKSLS